MADSPATKDKVEEKGLGRIIAAALIGLYVILFAVMNRHRVDVDWVFFDRSSRLIYVILVSAVLGALADRMLQRRGRSKD